jgi:outer membrane protein assembly factor BamD (BamD/ComL family)
MNVFLASAVLVAGHAAADDRPSAPALETAAGVHTAFERAARHLALGNYEDAATQYEAAARVAPKSDEAPEALKKATALRLGLGQVDQAIRDIEHFQKNYGATRKADTIELVLALAAYFVEHDDFKQAKPWLTRAMAQIDAAGKMDQQILAHTWLARSLVRLGDPAGGTREYQRVRDLWRDPGAVTRGDQPKRR